MSEAAREELGAIRRSIDNIDGGLIYLLAERFRLTTKVGILKSLHNMPASDPEREARIVERLRALALDADLDPAFAEAWFSFIVEEVIRHHQHAASTVAIDDWLPAPQASPEE
ncbi:chorismate mutase [Microbacterium sp. Gd 4-13]|uniref:chorismate mutase n=1 Tax=Microbacterium sp. Gd 4-13 TaxID=2173179 RepID=UPI000D56B70B|nr:chorismate mutase [Microbacterium sp. Gd 4-13]PVW02169.1 chorismate mutase [Microbacterium sp. Gd 4-13]